MAGKGGLARGVMLLVLLVVPSMVAAVRCAACEGGCIPFSMAGFLWGLIEVFCACDEVDGSDEILVGRGVRMQPNRTKTAAAQPWGSIRLVHVWSTRKAKYIKARRGPQRKLTHVMRMKGLHPQFFAMTHHARALQPARLASLSFWPLPHHHTTWRAVKSVCPNCRALSVKRRTSPQSIQQAKGKWIEEDICSGGGRRAGHHVHSAPPPVFERRVITKIVRAFFNQHRTRALASACRALPKMFGRRPRGVTRLACNRALIDPASWCLIATRIWPHKRVRPPPPPVALLVDAHERIYEHKYVAASSSSGGTGP